MLCFVHVVGGDDMPVQLSLQQQLETIAHREATLLSGIPDLRGSLSFIWLDRRPLITNF